MNREEAKRAGSLRSIQSAWSLKRIQIFANLGGKRSAVIEGIKLASLTLLPLSLVVGLCVKSILNVNRDIYAANAIYRSVERSQSIGELVSSLLKERGLRCQYLAIHDQNISMNLIEQMTIADTKTDTLIQSLKHQLPGSFSNFSGELNEFRDLTWSDRLNTTCSQVISWYTLHTHKLEEECSEPFKAGAVNSFWSAYFAYHAYLIAQDMIGLERALGSSYYGDGTLTLSNYVYFSKNVGGVEAILDQVTAVLYKPAQYLYLNLTSQNADLMKRVQESTRYITAHGLELDTGHVTDTLEYNTGHVTDNLEHNTGHVTDNLESNTGHVTDNAGRYFDSMTAYMNVVNAVEDFITDEMTDHVTQEKNERNREFQVVLSLVIMVLIISPAATTWYTYQSKNLMRKVADYTELLRDQKTQVNLEKKKAELLLCQMLPKSIVMDMAQNKTVQPEAYQEVTMFFSRIEEFATFVQRSDPFQVVDLLNHLYVACDNILDQYDAYKVETIGDSYVIVSGVPRQNGCKHSAEIATVALHFQMMMRDFQVPNMPDERIKLTVGIHTGPVAAGVMGIKQQRYCLFGDTVNTASRMMSTGLASRIQLSPSTAEHLHTNHQDQFSTESRGTTHIKGKGFMNTHWLIGREGFPYKAACNDRINEDGPVMREAVCHR